MDWRNNKFWRKNIRRMDEKTAEFDLLVQRTVKRIAIQRKLERSIKMLQEQASNSTKKYLGGEISLETLTILEKIFSFVKDFDKKLDDPVWESVSLKIKKYIPFININVFQYKTILRKIVHE